MAKANQDPWRALVKATKGNKNAWRDLLKHDLADPDYGESGADVLDALEGDGVYAAALAGWKHGVLWALTQIVRNPQLEVKLEKLYAILRGGKNGGAATHGKAVTTAEDIRQAVRDRLTKQPRDSVTSAGDWVACQVQHDPDYEHYQKRGWSAGNIKRAIHGMKKISKR